MPTALEILNLGLKKKFTPTETVDFGGGRVLRVPALPKPEGVAYYRPEPKPLTLRWGKQAVRLSPPETETHPERYFQGERLTDTEIYMNSLLRDLKEGKADPNQVLYDAGRIKNPELRDFYMGRARALTVSPPPSDEQLRDIAGGARVDENGRVVANVRELGEGLGYEVTARLNEGRVYLKRH